MEKIKFLDTTLRDGEQSPGCSMSADEKLTLAKQLERLGVNTIEAGFAASSPGDFDSVRDIGQQIQNSTVVSLCRASKNDIDAAVDALSDAKNWGIHTFISTSDLHMKHKLQNTRHQQKGPVKLALVIDVGGPHDERLSQGWEPGSA